MRLVIAFSLFLGVLDLAYSAPHASSEALLQELRNALNEKEVKQQVNPAETLALLCEPMATGVARVPTSQTQSSNEVVREQDPVSIGLGVAGLVVGLTGLGLQIADRVEGEEQSNADPIFQEITPNSNEMVREQDPVSIGLDIVELVGSLVDLGFEITDVGLQIADLVLDAVKGEEQSKDKAILQEIRKLLSREKEAKSTLRDQKRSVANVPLTEMLCTPVKVERTEKLAGGSSLRVRTLQ